MKSVQFSEWEKERTGVSGTVDVFGPYFGGGDVDESVGDEKRHLSLQLSQKGCLEKKNTGLLEEWIN